MSGARRWVVVVPVKGGPRSKSRLGLPETTRVVLARAFAEDTIEAVRSCDSVAATWVLTSDDDTVDWVTRTWNDVRVTRQTDSMDLNAALEQVIATLRGSDTHASVAIVAGDLPALTGAGLGSALAAATVGGSAAVVVDRWDRGTTTLMLPAGSTVVVSFGPDSARRHRLAGARVVGATDDVRCDVDTADDLAVAQIIGLGRSTRAGLAGPTARVRPVQATVRAFDEASGSGSVLRDDGVELPFGAAAFAASGLRLLRLGQRVRIETDEVGQRVTSLTILTLA